MICIFAKVLLVTYFIRVERDELAISSFAFGESLPNLGLGNHILEVFVISSRHDNFVYLVGDVGVILVGHVSHFV